jgi:hypothetical protein
MLDTILGKIAEGEMRFVIKRQSAGIAWYYAGLDDQSRARESDKAEEALQFETLAEAMRIRDRLYPGEGEIVDLDKPRKGKTPATSIGGTSAPRVARSQPDMQGSRPVLTGKQLSKLVKKTKKEK